MSTDGADEWKGVMMRKGRQDFDVREGKEERRIHFWVIRVPNSQPNDPHQSGL